MRSQIVMWLGVLCCAITPRLGAGAAHPCAKVAGPIAMSECLGATVDHLLRRIARLERQVTAGVGRAPSADETKPPTGMAAPTVRFQAAATAWGRFRDAECGAQSALYAEGAMEPIVRLVCISNLATARLRDLKHSYRDVLRVHR